MNEKKSSSGLIALMLNVPIFLINLIMFLPMLKEQIVLGKGTMLEMGTLIVWFINILTIIPLIVISILTAISITKDFKWRIILNFSLIGLSILMMILTNVFIIY